MSQDLMQLQNEAISLESNIGKLYLLFHDLFPEDAAFWGQLAIEENGHAELIRSGVDLFNEAGVEAVEVFPAPLESLKAANRRLIDLLEKYAQAPPSRSEAFYVALETEHSAGEIHFQRLMTNQTNSRVVQLFQELNAGDRDHADRIIAYMHDHGIEQQP